MRKALCLLFAALMVTGLFQVAVRPTSGAVAVSSAGGGKPIGFSPLSDGPLLGQAIRAGLIHPAGNAPPGSSVPDLSCTPAPCALKNVQASEGGSPVNEDPIAVNPNNTKDLLSGGNDYNCNNLQGFYASSDGGKTWRHTSMSNLANCGGDGDPGVGYTTTGVAYITGIDGCSSGNYDIIFQKSTNNGGSWSSPAIAVAPPSGFYLTDKDWLQIDTSASSTHKNTLYICNTMFDTSSDTEIAVTHSSNGGKTWTTVLVDAKQLYPNIDQFCDLAIAADGTVYVTWMRCTGNGPSGDCGGTVATMEISKSTDGGKTWSSPVKIHKVSLAPDACSCAYYGSLPNTDERVSDIPATGAFGMDLSTVMYTWTGSYMKVEVVSSTNGGTTWGSPVAVAPSTDKHDQFFPWLSTNSKGTVGVTWLDRRNDPSNLSYEAFATYSTTHGTSFHADIQIASKPSNPDNDGFGGGFMGDYTGNSWAGNTLYASWMDTRSGTNCQDEVGGLKV